MINKIEMERVSCYKHPATLETDKRINLIYGLNGTGKSTISDYLYDRTNVIYSNCSTEGLTDEEILVYNQRFIREYFYQPESLKGIFTLSSENREAGEKIKRAQQEIESLHNERITKNNLRTEKVNDLADRKMRAENKTWEIKTNYDGGDRVLAYCLEGYKGSKTALFTYLLSIAKPDSQPETNIILLKKEVEAIQGDNAQKYGSLEKLDTSFISIEKHPIFSKAIIGNDNSTVSKLINKLGNSDWVKEGLQYVSKAISKDSELCPFCQSETITASLIKNIEEYFDEEYENSLIELERLLQSYNSFITALPEKTIYYNNPFVMENKDTFDKLYDAFRRVMEVNKERIASKIKTPSQEIYLDESSVSSDAFNKFVSEINITIAEHNTKIEKKDTTLLAIKKLFWSYARWEYDQTIAAYQKEKSVIERKIFEIDSEIKKIEDGITLQKDIIAAQQKKTINIEEAIAKINEGLIELGIDGFHIEKHTDDLYKIVRNEPCKNTFETLSEGEKMIISFLYFREFCKGKRAATNTFSKKIVVIDDPISSLSHIYIFNIGRMIKNDFFNAPEYEQVFVLTHSLYFFYEMTFPSKEKRSESQKLFRISKNCVGSQIQTMRYEEIQNDYQSYWFIISDRNQQPALIANCMRNVLEYFFGFIEKRDLNNIFQKPELNEIKYEAFCRYINRESHSLGQNIFDIKEFDYENFKEAFRMVFIATGYKEHYNKMIKSN